SAAPSATRANATDGRAGPRPTTARSAGLRSTRSPAMLRGRASESPGSAAAASARAVTNRWTVPQADPRRLVRRSRSFRAELAVAVLERSPEVPTGDRAVRAPLRADLSHLLRGRTLAHTVGPADRILNAKIQLRQNVGSSQSKHQEHLGRPPA